MVLNYQPLPQLAVFDIDLGGPMSILYAGYGVMTFPCFTSTNPIEGCDLASLWPPHLEHIWGPKWLPVYGLLKITKT